MSEPMTDSPLTAEERTFTDASRLRVLALWFDKWDATAYADRQAILDDESTPGRNDVQRDLRRIADDLEAATRAKASGLDETALREHIQKAVAAHNDEWKSHVPMLCGMAVADAVLGERVSVATPEAAPEEGRP